MGLLQSGTLPRVPRASVSSLLGTDRGFLFHGSAGGGRWLAGGQRGAGVSVSVGLFSAPWPDASLWNLKGWLCPVLAAWARPTSARIRCFQRASRNLLCTRSHGAINQSGVCAPSITSTPVSRIFLPVPGLAGGERLFRQAMKNSGARGRRPLRPCHLLEREREPSRPVCVGESERMCDGARVCRRGIAKEVGRANYPRALRSKIL